MFVSITTTDTADEPIENATMVAEEMERWLADMEGFEGFLLLTRPGKALGLVFWESQEIAERHSVVRAQFRERMLTIAGVQIEGVEEYEVVFSRLGRRLSGDSG